MDVSIRIAGEAGQGVVTAGSLLVGAFASMGLHVFSTQSYMSRIRGGLNWYDIRIGERELFSRKEKADLLVPLTEEASGELRGDVSEGGLVLSGGSGAASLPFARIAREVGGADVMGNSVAAGVVFAALGYDCERLCEYIAVQFEKKGREVAEKNVQCARKGAELAGADAGAVEAPAPCGAPAHVYSGTEAVGLAAATAGVKFATAYPMTPATGVLTYLAGVADEYGIVVEQAEDEIAAINMVCGAAYAGVPAITVTSGGGFALMCEGLSLAGMMELPVFVMLGQRPGPATGLPTRTAQQDLKFALSAGHGEFPRAVYAPGDARQAYELTRRALETAHKFQSPVILMTDQFLADNRKNMPELDRTLRPINRHILGTPPEDYVRYAAAEDGVSPRALPGSRAFVICDSDEHTEDGHITEDLGAHVRLQDKRMAKGEAMLAEALPPEFYGPPDAGHVLVAWGSTYGPCREAVDLLVAAGRSVAMVHFSQLWPIDAPAARAVLGLEGPPAASGRTFTSVEGNCAGQFASVLREAGVLQRCELMLRYDGLPFSAEEIAARCRQ